MKNWDLTPELKSQQECQHGKEQNAKHTTLLWPQSGGVGGEISPGLPPAPTMILQQEQATVH